MAKATPKLIRQELTAIFRVSWKQLFAISILMWFLLFMLNIFLSISLYSGQFSTTLRDKLGMYFYIKDTPGNEHVIYKEIMEMKDELEKEWLDVTFSSKEDAFDFLQKRIPDVVTSFEKFGIENPLPATLYIMFDNEAEYEVLKSKILSHKHIILNIKDISQWATLKQQENRVLTIINFTNFVKVAWYVLIIVLFVIILFFLTFLLENIFQRFRRDLGIKKLLGATRAQVTKSFMWITGWVLAGSFVFATLLIGSSVYAVNYYVKDLFDVSVFAYIRESMGYLWGVLFWEVLLFVILSLLVSYAFVNSLNKKI